MTEERLDLPDLLGARKGIVCAVGAGGKKSVLHALARSHPGRVALTATVHTAVFPADLGAVVVDDEHGLADGVTAAARHRSVCYACPSSKPGRHAGVSPGEVRRIHEQAGFDVTLVKSDGARMRWIKAPRRGEPVLVPEPDTIIPVVSARAIGEPLDERVAHRVDRVSAVTGIEPGQALRPEAVARLMASDRGALAGVGEAQVVPVINMVDDAEREALARHVAREALALTDRFDRVVLCCLRQPARAVGVVER